MNWDASVNSNPSPSPCSIVAGFSVDCCTVPLHRNITHFRMIMTSFIYMTSLPDTYVYIILPARVKQEMMTPSLPCARGFRYYDVRTTGLWHAATVNRHCPVGLCCTIDGVVNPLLALTPALGVVAMAATRRLPRSYTPGEETQTRRGTRWVVPGGRARRRVTLGPAQHTRREGAATITDPSTAPAPTPASDTLSTELEPLKHK